MNYTNPVLSIKDPLKRQWAYIVQVMDTHLNGVCPLHIYKTRRPLESEDDFALLQRAEAFEPVTMQDFELTISKIVDFSISTNIKLFGNTDLFNRQYIINNKDIYDYCLNDLIKQRENDPNSIIVLLPDVKKTEYALQLNSIVPYFVLSKNIDTINDNYVKFLYYEKDNIKYYMVIENGVYYIEYKKDNNAIKDVIIETSIITPYIHISDNVVNGKILDKGKYIDITYRLPYLFGAACWGNKFVGQESDFEIQSKRSTFLREFRAKPICTNAGYTMVDGCHVDGNGHKCGVCNGTGVIQDASPLHTTFVDYSSILADNDKIPPLVQWSEPPQSALMNNLQITKEYYDNMLNALGIVKQNMTNQSGVSKSFDVQQNKKLIKKIVLDNLRVIREWYNLVCEFYNIKKETEVYIIGDIVDNSVDEILESLAKAKQNGSPPNVIQTLIDNIYLKTINPKYAEQIINIAKKYDILYLYSKDDLTLAKAHLGSNIGMRETYIHNTIINTLEEYFNNNENTENVIAYLDEYYAKFEQKDFNI